MNKVISVVFLFVIFSLGMVSFSFAGMQNANLAKSVEYKIKKGDMLRKISLKYYGTEKKVKFLARINGIKNPDKIQAGAVIKLGYVGKKVSFKKHAKSLRSNLVVKPQIKDVEIKKEEKTPAVEKAANSNDDIENGKSISNEAVKIESAATVDEKKSTVAEMATAEKEKRFVHIAPTEKVIGASDIVIPVAEDKSKLAQETKEPMSKTALEFTQDDVMPENAPEAKEAESHIGDSSKMEHQVSLDTMYSTNKAETMKSAMLGYMAWTKVPSLNENYRLGGGIFTNVWEDKFAGDRIRAVMPGVQLGFKYNRHTEDHLMRMFHATLMTGYEFQNLRGKDSAPVMDAPVDPMASDDAMSSDMVSDSSMNNSMPLKVANSLKLGSMLEYHYQLSPKSTLELMNENWYSLRKADMAMDPKFSLVASHVYTDGDWNWRAGIGPQLEENGTWRLHVIPAEITYKNVATVGVFGNLYPFNKGEMYSDFSRSNLATIGVNLRFNIGANMHKGHESKDHQQ